MLLKINNIHLSIDDDVSQLKHISAKKLNISEQKIDNFKIIKQSIDARKKSNIEFIYSVSIETQENISSFKFDENIQLIKSEQNSEIEYGIIPLKTRPIIIGTGPAGMFAGLFLAKNGYRPIIVERGQDVDSRTKIVNKFWEQSILDTETNVQFGEGGAGTFSDGKLTTRINDKRSNIVFEEFVNNGAPQEILYKYKPHIGTDILKDVVKNIRNKIIECGGEVRFNSKVTNLLIKDNIICGVEINNSENILSDIVILAIGHSARDTYEMLLKNGISMSQKPFSIGARIEHLQKTIDISQYGNFAGHPKLGPADYQLVYKNKDRAAYSFCMCPGGLVVGAASEQNTIVTNGMSEFARNKENANSALVVSVEPSDFNSKSPLAGIEFQRTYEKLAFQVGGGNYSAPIQKVGDFINGISSKNIGTVKPSYTGNISPTDLSKCLPDFVISTMRDGIIEFDKKIKGFADKDAILTGVETRTSAPVRIERDEKLQSINIKGLYPCGEGAGYAGGIVSAAVDGVKVAEQIISIYKP